MVMFMIMCGRPSSTVWGRYAEPGREVDSHVVAGRTGLGMHDASLLVLAAPTRLGVNARTERLHVCGVPVRDESCECVSMCDVC